MSKVKILYVEDEPFLAKIVKESLESRDFDVTLVSDGSNAVSRYQDFKPDICILDVMLPNIDGFEIAREIRAHSPLIPIIFLTAKNQTEDLLKGFESGGNDYIKKPFSLEELVVRVHNLVNLSQSGRKAMVEMAEIPLGRYVFFPQKYELHLADEVNKLSHRETQLLKILADHQNYPVERKEILQQVWGDDSFFNSRNLDVYITRLRNYLKQDDNIQIVTLKGIGYHFVVEKGPST